MSKKLIKLQINSRRLKQASVTCMNIFSIYYKGEACAGAMWHHATIMGYLPFSITNFAETLAQPARCRLRYPVETLLHEIHAKHTLKHERKKYQTLKGFVMHCMK